MIDSALFKITKSEAKEPKIHFVYAGGYYGGYEDTLRSLILIGMMKYKIKSVIVTIINMERTRLITKDKMESFCKGKEYQKDSVNDDLESFLEDLRLGKEPNEAVDTYFLPKLTEKEMELVEKKKEVIYIPSILDFQNLVGIQMWKRLK